MLIKTVMTLCLILIDGNILLLVFPIGTVLNDIVAILAYSMAMRTIEKE